MAEFCRQCFIECLCSSRYEIEHIVMSEENCFCEGCGCYVPVVDYIENEERLNDTRTAQSLRR